MGGENGWGEDWRGIEGEGGGGMGGGRLNVERGWVGV